MHAGVVELPIFYEAPAATPHAATQGRVSGTHQVRGTQRDASRVTDTLC